MSQDETSPGKKETQNQTLVGLRFEYLTRASQMFELTFIPDLAVVL